MLSKVNSTHEQVGKGPLGRKNHKDVGMGAETMPQVYIGEKKKNTTVRNGGFMDGRVRKY